MEKAGTTAGLTGQAAPHKCGNFPALNVVMHGNGTEWPINLNNKEHAPLVEKLLACEDLQHLASFASSEQFIYTLLPVTNLTLLLSLTCCVCT